MFLAYVGRIIKFALQDFWRNIWLSVVTITILVLTLFLVNVLVVFNIMTATAVDLVKEKVDISLYFSPATSTDNVMEVKNTLSKMPEVAKITFVSKDDALQQFKKKHQNDPAILETLKELDSNPLGHALVIKARTLDQYPIILSAVDKPEYNQIIIKKDFSDRQAVIKNIFDVTNKVREVGIMVIIIFALIAGLIVFNTVRVAIYTHREEIGIMKLVGGTNWFIRLPYLVESVLFSFISCVIAVMILYPLLHLAEPYLSAFFGGVQFSATGYFNSNFISIFGIELLAVIVLNIFSSLIAIGRYLKV